MAIKRLHYFDHQFLIEADFTDEQKYHLDMRRRLNRVLYTFGIAAGLEVLKTASKAVTVNPGTAVDRDGREIVLETPQVVDLSNAVQFPPGAVVFITITYQEQESDPSPAASAPGNTRITEQATIQAVTAAPPTDGTVIRLASIILDGAANVPGNLNDQFDGGVRQAVSLRGERWPASLAGVSNPGGNIALLPSQAIVITPDDSNNRITISENHSARTDNPHATTAAQLGALSSVDGVSNPGGNIDLVAAQAIVLTPDDANNRITISENHSARTDNPHATTAAQLGALLTTDYDLRRRSLAAVVFSQGNADGATTTVNVGFQPKVVIVVGTVTANLGGRAYSGGIGAFAFTDPPIGGTLFQRCSGFGITRTSNTDWFSRSILGTNLCTATIFDSGAAPAQAENLNVAIQTITASGLVALFNRAIASAGFTALSSFSITLTLMCMG